MPSKWTSILIGALAYTVLGILIQFLFQGGGPMAGILGCLVMLSAGLVAVWHYTSTYHLTIPAGQGASIGALAGVIGGLIAGALSWMLIAAGLFPDPLELARRQLEAQPGMTEEQMEQAMAMAETFSNPVIGMGIGLVLGALVGAVSGAIGAVLFKKGDESAGLEEY